MPADTPENLPAAAVPNNILEFPVSQRPSRIQRSMLETDTEIPVPVMKQVDLVQLMATGVAPRNTMETPVASQNLVVPRKRSETVNRVTNVVIAIAALLLLTPFLLLVALAVKLSSRGPVLYIQKRVGIDRRRRPTTAVFDRRQDNVGGLTFDIYKFRSMRVDAEQMSGAVWATTNDPRVTPVGRLLRKMRIDEIPQLINVIKGDMNIVGPRPERPSIFAELRQNIQEYPLRQQARPGITGWAQINRAYDATMDDVREKVRFDLEYLERQSFIEDLRIMVRTLPVMLFRRGAC